MWVLILHTKGDNIATQFNHKFVTYGDMGKELSRSEVVDKDGRKSLEIQFNVKEYAQLAASAFRRAIISAMPPAEQAAAAQKAHQIQSGYDNERAKGDESEGDNFIQEAIDIRSCLQTNCVGYTPDSRKSETEAVEQKCKLAKSLWQSALEKTNDSAMKQRITAKLQSGTGISCGKYPGRSDDSAYCVSNGGNENLFFLGAGEMKKASPFACLGQAASKNYRGAADEWFGQIH